jgi:hypothetical protein
MMAILPSAIAPLLTAGVALEAAGLGVGVGDGRLVAGCWAEAVKPARTINGSAKLERSTFIFPF